MSNPHPDCRSNDGSCQRPSDITQAAVAAVERLDRDDIDDQALRHWLETAIADRLDTATGQSRKGHAGATDTQTSAAELVDADTLLEGIAMPAFVLAPDHTLVAYNDGLATLLGIDAERAVGEDYRETVTYAVYADGSRELSLANKVIEAPHSADEEFETVSKVGHRTEYTGEYVYEDTSTMRNRRGEEIPIAFIATPIFEDGDLAAVLEIAEERDAGREEFPGLAGIISHDLRNPLEVATTHTDLAEEDLGDEHYEHISESLDRMANIVDDVMALYKQADAEQDTQVQNISLLAQQAWDTVDTGHASLAVDQMAATGDRTQLLRLFENLFRNAVEHGGTDVTVRVGELDGHEGFFVADDGDGIPSEDRDTVLEHGYSTTDTGTGFGLSIVHQIARNHGWEMAVTDSADGGARFEFVFES